MVNCRFLTAGHVSISSDLFGICKPKLQTSGMYLFYMSADARGAFVNLSCKLREGLLFFLALLASRRVGMSLCSICAN